MKRPSYTNILGVRVRIEYIPDLVKNEGILGDACDTEYLIRLDHDLTGDRFKRVLRHERTHMALRMSGLVEHINDETEEALCRLMENFRP